MENKVTNYKGEKVIVRGLHSGVFYATLAERNGQEVRLTDCRRIWSWRGAASISLLAVEGVKDSEGSKITMPVPSMEILDAVEILRCEDAAIANLASVKEWKAE